MDLIDRQSDTISRQAAIEGKMNLLVRCDDDKLRFKDVVLVEYLQNMPSAESEQLTDKEQRIFLAAMGREEKVCKQGFVDGLREAEKEFDDPELYQIIDADDAREKLGDEAYRRLTDE